MSGAHDVLYLYERFGSAFFNSGIASAPRTAPLPLLASHCEIETTPAGLRLLVPTCLQSLQSNDPSMEDFIEVEKEGSIRID